MKVYILTDDDFERLKAELDRNPEYGQRGGSSVALSVEQRDAHKEAHGFYSHIVRTWIDKVKGAR